MTLYSCKYPSCNFETHEVVEFSSHVKNSHSLSEKKYFESYAAKLDLMTEEPISFKSIEQYLLTDFCNKKNLLAWLKNNKCNGAAAYLLDKMRAHSLIKSVIYFPSSSEIRSVSYLPSIKTYKYFFEDLNAMIDSSGLSRRYDYSLSLNDLKLKNIQSENVIVDTREQKPIKFKGIGSISEKLDYGDYSFDKILCVERKSLSDLISTLSSGFERFEREVERCKQANGYLVLVCETSINKFLSFNFSRTGRYSKASPEFIFHRFRDICKKFPENLQFCFSGSRSASAELIPFILSLGIEKARQIDFQYLIENL
jgi:hypothetical protein